MNTSAVQPFQFEPELTVGLNQENSAADDRPEDYQRVEEARDGVCAATACQCQARTRAFAVKSFTFCQQLSRVG